MNDIQIFNNPEYGDIRTIRINGEPWFVGNDVGKALGYQDPRSGVRKLVDEDDKRVCPVGTGNLQQTIVNESGLYALIFGSKLENAKKFKKWVTSEVLPTLRKTGTYSLPQTPDEKIQLLAQGYVEIKKDVESVKGEVTTVKSEIQQLKDELPIFLNEAQIITDHVKKKGVEMLGGKDTEAYRSRSIRTSVYFDIYTELYRQFGISSYKNLKRNQFNSALQVIKEYKLPIILKNKIDSANAQGSFKF